MVRTMRVAAVAVLMAAAVARGQEGVNAVQSLAGEWRFSLDRGDVGVKEGWFGKPLAGTDKIKLPGILQSQGYGDDISIDTPWVAALPRSDVPGNPNVLKRWWLVPEYKAYTVPGNIKVPYLSQPLKHYLGAAWYQKEVEIPAGQEKRAWQLYLERPRWGSTVWVDEKEVGTSNSLVAPHEFEAGILSAGKHLVTVRLDNRMSVFPGPNAITPGYRPDGHSVSDSLGQTWNGMVGKIELRGRPAVYLSDVQVYPNVAKRSVKVVVTVGNATGAAGNGTLWAAVGKTAAVSAPIAWDAKTGKGEVEVAMGEGAKTWDEFSPNLQTVDVSLMAGAAGAETRQVTFGLREITHDGPKFLLNGREINLRMTHSGGDFPLTGYPATDVDAWKKIIQVCKDYGLNGIRFHSWCPPEACFTAADELGFYIQPECGMWNNFSNPGMAEMLEKETDRMMKAYGNHPSYLLLSPTNEPAGAWTRVLPQWTAAWYQKDPRRLYAENTGRVNLKDPQPTFAISPVRGNTGWFGNDYARQLQGVTVPVLGHEVGQWCSYPDFNLINKFTGYLKPGNYEIYRDSAVAHGVLGQNKEFAWASGKFQLACYKEEIEANLRTPNYAGFQLLDLHDYLGQGGALVGVLDAFWESKGYVTPAEFRRFCGDTVPLVRLKSYVFRTGDAFETEAEIAHFGEKAIAGATPFYKIVDSAGKTVLEMEWEKRDVPIGKNIALGKITADLSKFAAPMQYKLIVGLRGTAVENDWKFWLYPAAIDTAAPADVLVTTVWKDAQAKLAAGGKVLYTPPAKELDDTCPPLNNVPVFWNRLMNPKLESMLGLLCDVKHPALEQFPTEGFCDWQWTDVVRDMRAINIEKAPGELKPIVQAIDVWSRNYKLGVIFECQVGPGKLLVSAVDVQTGLEKRTVASQLRRSLLSYMGGSRFVPAVAMTAEQADKLWPAAGARVVVPVTEPAAAPGDIQEGPNVAPRVR